MNFPFYVGDGNQHHNTPALLPVSRRTQLITPDKYLADPGLVDACNVALLLGQPLLLTGEPGTGKTLFASSLAWELGLAPPLKFETKSTSMAHELFYTYDALRHFQAAQSGAATCETLSFLTYHALGAAILHTHDFHKVAHLLPPDFKHAGKQRTVILIDEVDKAPRDFPNDILNELDMMYFRIPELGNIAIEADPNLHPIIIITSNSEKNLPDAFLRRCAYYNIPFPSSERLRMIIVNRLGLHAAGYSDFLDTALDIFSQLRNPSAGLRKRPATAELLGWILSLKDIAPEQENPLLQRDLALKTISSLVKTAEDQRRATDIIQRWINAHN